MEQVKVFVTPFPDDTRGKSFNNEINVWLKEQDGKIEIVERKFAGTETALGLAIFYKQK